MNDIKCHFCGSHIKQENANFYEDLALNKRIYWCGNCVSSANFASNKYGERIKLFTIGENKNEIKKCTR